MGTPPPGCRASEAVGRERLGALPVFVMALQVGSSNGPVCKPSAAATCLPMRHNLPHCPAGTCMQAGVTPQPLQFFIFQCVPFIMPEHWASGAICEDLPGYTIHSEASMRQVRSPALRELLSREGRCVHRPAGLQHSLGGVHAPGAPSVRRCCGWSLPHAALSYHTRVGFTRRAALTPGVDRLCCDTAHTCCHHAALLITCCLTH